MGVLRRLGTGGRESGRPCWARRKLERGGWGAEAGGVGVNNLEEEIDSVEGSGKEDVVN